MAVKKQFYNKKSVKYNSNSYNSTSVAYKTDTEYYEDNAVKEKKADKNKNLQKEYIRYKIEKKINRIISIKFVMGVIFIFICSLITMISYAKVVEKRETINSLRLELSKLQSENNSLSAEVAEHMNLEEIEKDAIERLGMTKPQPYQTIYVDVPQESYTIQYNVENDLTEQSLDGKFSFSKLFSVLKQALKNLFN